MRRRLRTYLPYGLASLLVLGPMVRPGYILVLDMVFAPRLPFPHELTHDYPLHLGMWLVGRVLPSQVVQKLLLLAILLGSSIGMHRLIEALFGREQRTASTYLASLFYMVNPFTYSRFMTGQYAVLLGYAMLPWFMRLLLAFARYPSRRRALRLGLAAAVMVMVSIHAVGDLVLLCAVAVGLGAWRYRHAGPQLRSYGQYVGLAAAAFVLASSYWLVPVLRGTSSTAARVSRMGSADVAAFAVTGGDVVMKLAGALRLQGFWADSRGLYVLPQQVVPLWGLAAAALLLLVVYGLGKLWRQRPGLARWLALTMVLAMLLAVAGVNSWTVQHVPFVAGFRDAHKFVGLLALGYAVALAYSLRSLSQKCLAYPVRDRLLHVFTLGVVVLFTWPMWWAFQGQLLPRQYPADWYQANMWLNRDHQDFRVLFLPWYQYMSFGFSERIIANPAPLFFDKPMLVSDDPEFGSLPPTGTDATVHRVAGLLRTAGYNPQLSRQLADNRIKYILVARELDYEQYDYLRNTPGLMLVKTTPTLLLYRNQIQE